MGLDIQTLQLAYAAVAALLVILFFSAYRTTGSRLSLCWTIALLFQVGAGTGYSFVDSPVGDVAVPLGDVLTALSLLWAWAGARSLRDLTVPRWTFFIVPPAVAAVTVLGQAFGTDEAGVIARYSAGVVLATLSTIDVARADRRHRRVRRPLLIASALLVVFFAIRVVETALGAGGAVLTTVFDDAVTSLVLMLTLVLVSFSIASLSHSDAEDRVRSRERLAAFELSQGAQVQQALLPFHRLDGVQFPVSGACVPSRSLSGDFFDWTADDERLIITVGDVMGKGVGAAMLGATIRAGLRAARKGDPGADVEVVMQTLGDDLVRNGSFVTLFHAYLDRESSTLTILDAGHGLAVIVRRDGSKEQIASANLPLGLNIGEQWTVSRVELHPGDRLLVFSDGVLDLFDGTLASLHRAADIALASDVEDMDDAVDRIRELADSAAHDDDVTVVALERPVTEARLVLR